MFKDRAHRERVKPHLNVDNHLPQYNAEDDDRDERNNGPFKRTLRAAYYPLIGEAPELGPGDHTGAREYLAKIVRVRADMSNLTKSEVMRIRKMEKKWRARAEGRSAKFEKYGTRLRHEDRLTVKDTVVGPTNYKIDAILADATAELDEHDEIVNKNVAESGLIGLD